MVWRRRGLPGIHSVCIDPRDAQRVTVGVSCGGVLTSPDGGDSWETRCKSMVAEYMPPEQAENSNVQDPHLVVQCPAEPDKMRAQHHNGIFVTRTRDGGLTFDKLTQGLPPVYSVIFS